MQTLVFVLLSIIGLIAIWLQVDRWLHQPHRSKGKYYILYTHNSEQDIEWFVRSVNRWSRLEGADIKLIVVDCGSADDTLPIIQKFEKQGMTIETLTPHEPKTEHLLQGPYLKYGQETKMIVDLRKKGYTCESKAH